MKKDMLFVEVAGLWLSVRAGELALRHRDGSYVHLEQSVKTIVAAARGFCVTTPAVRHCITNHVELLIADEDASFVSLLAPMSGGDARRSALKVREKQFRAAFNKKKTVEIAKAIVGKKIVIEGHTRLVKNELLAELAKAKSCDDVRYVEAQAARIWWRQFEGFEIRFAGATVPASWNVWPGRYIGRRQGRLGELAPKFTARDANHPMQALLNFATAIMTGRMTRAVIAKGFDPCFGFLHEGRKQGRLSLVWDCVEPLRPKLVKAMFGYVSTHEFERLDFLVLVHKISGERIVRLAQSLAKEIAALTLKTIDVRECLRMVDCVGKLLNDH